MSASRPRPWPLVVAALLLAVGAVLRVQGARGDLWFDELWSLRHAQNAEQLSDLFLDPELQHDNNHWLNTAWMRALGPDRDAFAHRSLALVGGILSSILLALAGFRRGRVAGVVAAALGALSFLLVLYGSEARGYGTVTLFALAGLLLVADSRERSGPLAFVPYWVVCVLGTLSHLSFLYCLPALGAWSLSRLRDPSPGRWLARVLAWQAVPAAFVVALAWIVLRHVEIGGGPGYDSILQVVGETVAHVFGLYGDEKIAPLLTALAALVAVAHVLLLIRERDDAAIFYAGVLALSPALFLALRPPEVLYVRYFLVCVPFLLLAFAELCQRLWSLGGAGRVGAGMLVLAVLVGNVARLVRFQEVGRGGYSAAVQHLVEHTPTPRIEISIDGAHNTELLRYHAQRLGVAGRLAILPPPAVRRAPRWVLSHDLDRNFRPHPQLHVFGTRYELVREFGWIGLSGWSWFLYQDVRTKGR